MSLPADQPLRIGPIGLDERQRNALRMVFEGVCHRAYCFADDTAPEAWIVDLDHVGAGDALATAWDAQGRRPVLFMALQDPGEVRIGNEVVQGFFLRKPFRLDDFVAHLPALADAARRGKPAVAPKRTHDHQIEPARLAKVDSQGSSRAARLLSEDVALSLVGNSPDIDLHDSTQWHQVYYDPEHFLHHRVALAWQRAKAAGRPLRIEGPWPTFTLFPASDQVQLAAPVRDYRAAAMLPKLHGQAKETLLDADQVCVEPCLPYAGFVWKLTLWAARGRLPRGTPLQVPVFLRWWPNFTRLDQIPAALAIAALWSREPRTLIDSAQALGIPQRWLFSFYSAASALDLAGTTRRSVDFMFTPQPLPKPNGAHGLLGRVLDKLRNAL